MSAEPSIDLSPLILARLLSAPLSPLSRTFKVMLLWYIFDDSLSHFGLGKLLTYCESHCSITPLSIKNLELIHNQIFVIQPPSLSSVKIETNECFSTILIPQCHCKTRPNHWEIIHPVHTKKRWLEVTMKVVVFFAFLMQLVPWFCSYLLNKLS